MEIKKITKEMQAALNVPLSAEAIKQHPSKKFLSTINSIFVTERLNEVFGAGSWRIKSEVVNNTTKMIVVKTTLAIPEYGVYLECYGGNDNVDMGDAYKGAVTDAITKIGSWLGIGAHVWKNDPYAANHQQQAAKQAAPKAAKPAAQPTGLTKEAVEKAVIDYLYANPKAEQWYLNKAGVSDMLELNLIEVYNHLKSNNKI